MKRVPHTMTTSMHAKLSARELAAEAIGTGLLVLVIVGSGIMAEEVSRGNHGVALLANSLATGMILVVLITCLEAVSGAHFNPAVTFAFWLKGEIGPRKALGYCAVQILAGVAGTIVAHLMFGLEPLQIGTHMRSGPALWLGEVVATFALVFTIFACLASRPKFVATAVGLVITAGIWATSSTSFANPAVTIARAFSDTYTAIRPVDGLGFIAAEFLGAGIAVVLCAWLFAEITRQEAR